MSDQRSSLLIVIVVIIVAALAAFVYAMVNWKPGAWVADRISDLLEKAKPSITPQGTAKGVGSNVINEAANFLGPAFASVAGTIAGRDIRYQSTQERDRIALIIEERRVDNNNPVKVSTRVGGIQISQEAYDAYRAQGWSLARILYVLRRITWAEAMAMEPNLASQPAPPQKT